MRISTLIASTLREAPSEAETPGHQLLLRAGLVQQLAAGVYSFLPVGWRAMRKLENVIREEMDSVGGQEVHMPVLQPVELWAESGRLETYVPPLLVVKDRRERELALGPTHEEVVTDLFRQQVQSYRNMPALVYQIQNKFRNEVRSRGGLIRLREFTMKDMYSFDADWAGLDKSYDAIFGAYTRLFERVGLPAIAVDADSGPIGGKDSQEFMHLTDVGEDTVLICNKCGYAANTEKADHKKKDLPPEEHLQIEEVATPGIKTIDALADFLKIDASKTLKAVFYAADGEPVFVAIRGDLEVNEAKLRNALGGADLRLMDDKEVADVGLVAGSASPVGLKESAKRKVPIVADDTVEKSPNLVAGANKPDTHLKNVNYQRDWQADIVTDISEAREGDACVRCDGGVFDAKRGIEIGHVFKLGTLYTEKLDAKFLDADGQQQAAVMGCYGIGVDRLLAAIIEANHDENGIVWPKSIAPFGVHLVGLNLDDEDVRVAAEKLYDDLRARGVEVLFDDRDERPGVKFKDADLIGIPLRVVIGKGYLRTGALELQRRVDHSRTDVPPTELVPAVRDALRALSP
jgi:prolyl-tRNA synthetase